ncbi:MAG TPA: NAD-dependent succinate-semialdehyde dehydrogenase [Candidatus Eisenbacteria bacterium]|nr:NAD-dependent succinate-semialdehyde dehydrogenase [Candidatus Eisenbacteria bacterium]
MLRSIDPTTGKAIRDYPETTPAAIGAALSLADRAFRAWRRESFETRAAVLRRAAARLRERAAEDAILMALEMGKPVAQGRAEAEKCAWTCDYFAEHAAAMLASQPAPSDASRSYVTFQPLGVVLAVMPWNFPYWQVFRFAAPALMAGNACVLKHASNVSGCALAIEAIFREAGLPEGLFTTLLVPGSAVEPIVEMPLVRAVTLTGSAPAGRAVAAAAGRALKKTVLELGGSDPYVILEDADLDAAAATCATSRLINGGQSCIAAKRFIVVEPALEAFTDRLVTAMKAKRWGNPLAEGADAPDLGPMARADLRDELHHQVTASVDRGARLLLGGAIPEGPGAFYPPTVLDRVRPGMPAYGEETFGPVAAIVAARDEADAVRIANDTPFGLGAAVFTRDLARGERIAAAEFEAGACFVNGFVRSDPRLPFGGIKESGYGRELSSFGIHEFTNVKTVWVG